MRPHKCKSCSCYDFVSDFCCLSCDKKFEDHETLYETEKERQQQGKPIRDQYLPLAQNPQVQKEVMKKLGIDGRSAEERFRDELQMEETKDAMLNLQLNDGAHGGPMVNMIIDTRKNQAPKQDLNKPERSIRLMQEKGIAGQKAPVK